MYLAYFNKNIPVGTTIAGVSLTMKKYEIAKHAILILTESKKGSNWYLIRGTTLLYHESWLNTITTVTDNTRAVQVASLNSGMYWWVIASMVNSSYVDVRTSRTLSNVAGAYDHHVFEIRDTLKGHEHKTIECARCHEVTYTFESEIDGFCSACYNNYRKKCSECGKVFIPLANEKECPKCKNNKSQCCICGVSTVSALTVEGDVFCKSCYTNKSHEGVIEVCQICSTPFYTKGDKLSHTSSYGKVCKLCSFEITLSQGVHNYTYKPSPIFYGKGDLFYGIELEIETPMKREMLHKYIKTIVNDDGEFIYCKMDASIGDDSSGRRGGAGFEIVTHPFSYEWINSPKGVDKIQSIMSLKDFRCRSYNTNTCGMHVHMSKDAFDEHTLRRFLTFIFENKDFNIKISERIDMEKVNRYCSFIPETDIETLSIDRYNSDGEGRHKAVNLNNDATVEVRIFRGTLGYNGFMKNIEYCQALYDFCSTKIDLTVEDFRRYVSENNKRYPHLNLFIGGMK